MKNRRAFTLVELLVALAIIVLLAAIVLAFWPRRENVATLDAAGQIEAYLAGAKARALKENRPISVRFISYDNYRTFDSCILMDAGGNWMPTPAAGVYLELPDGLAIHAANQNPNPNVVGNTARQVGAILLGTVAVGDMLEIVEVSTSIHRITAIDYNTNTMTLAAQKEAITDPMTGAILQWAITGIPNVSRTANVRLPLNYRYLRQPRPLVGEQPFQLPKNVFIHGATGVMPTSVNIPVGRTGEYEITFSPAGLPINSTGRSVLWVADLNNVAKPRLVCVYPTGAIASHDVGPTGNEFAYTTDGR